MLKKHKMRRPGLLAQMAMLISIVVFIGTLLGVIMFTLVLRNVLFNNLGHEAMAIAKTTASDPRIIQAFNTKNPALKIQPTALQIKTKTGAGYVVVGNLKGLRYSANKDNELDKEMGTSNAAVLTQGKSVIYEGAGVSGPAIKAKTPIYNDKGEIIGVSSVGFLLNNVDKKLTEYDFEIIGMSLAILGVGIVGAMVIAGKFKKLIFGLEPEEISFLFKEKEATLESVRDAIIALNTDSHIVSMNKKAREVLDENEIAVGGKIHNIRLNNILDTVIKNNQVFMNQRVMLNKQIYMVDSSPIVEDMKVRGAVLTLRSESDIELLVNEVSQIKGYSDNLRAQNHEYLNKLNTIFGLLQLGEYKMAMSQISEEIKERQDIVAFLMTSVKNPLISACLLGQMNKANELKVRLELDPDSNLTYAPSVKESQYIVAILSNIIDNAMDAVRLRNGTNGLVRVSFTDLGRDLVFDIEDNGYGISIEQEAQIFTEGYTTKVGENHGLGLAIVNTVLEQMDGQIFITKSQLGGARFSVVIPIPGI